MSNIPFGAPNLALKSFKCLNNVSGFEVPGQEGNSEREKEFVLFFRS